MKPAAAAATMHSRRRTAAHSIVLGTAALLVVSGCGNQHAAADAKTKDVSLADVTFNRDVAPILFANCGSCHRPGEAAPFSLLTYEDAQRRANQIADVTRRRFMPPWQPAEGH